MSPDVSIVIPVLNEREALPGLLREIAAVCERAELRWEAIVVDDGSDDGSFELLAQLAVEQPAIRAVRFRRNLGKSAALAVGFERAAGAAIVTIDGDGQDDPADIPVLLDGLREADLVSGWKVERRDPLGRRIASRVFNLVAGAFTGVRVHDMNSGIKAYRAECARSLEVYGELHRFLPALADQKGWRVVEAPVNHRPRAHGSSRFGSERFLRGGLDLLTVVFIGRYLNRPLHLFGGVGLCFTGAGLVICAYLTVLKISGKSLGGRPLLFLGVLLIVVGIQLFTFGLLAQMLALTRREGRGRGELATDLIDRTIGFRSDPLSPEPGSGRSATEASAGG
jgi:glycosyltransferase involved in cell wall biosynthesis